MASTKDTPVDSGGTRDTIVVGGGIRDTPVVSGGIRDTPVGTSIIAPIPVNEPTIKTLVSQSGTSVIASNPVDTIPKNPPIAPRAMPPVLSSLKATSAVKI